MVLDGPNYLVDDEPFEHEDGWIDLPHGPGPGIEVDWDRARAAERPDARNAPPVRYDDGSVADRIGPAAGGARERGRGRRPRDVERD